MATKFEVALSKIINDFKLEIIYLPKPAEQIMISGNKINRPGLQIAGFFDVFDNSRVQVLGKTELTYLSQIDPDVAVERLEHLFRLKPPVVIISRSLDIPDIIINAAKNNEVPLLRTNENTGEFISDLLSRLNIDLAPRITRHGVFMELFGDGVLIMGDSGVGKSEVAIELITRGHRLVADDAGEIRKVSSKVLVGSSPENIRHFMELRGIGVVNAQRMFGMRAVKLSEKVLLIVKLEPWDETKTYDRLGLESEVMEILSIQVPCVTIPVKPGRNIAAIIEAAVMNQRLKRLGYSAPHDLMRGLGMSDDDLPPAPKASDGGYWDYSYGGN